MTPPGSTVLVVDDDPAMRRRLVDVLWEEGFAVRQATDGEEALLMVETTTVQVVVSDVRMPRLDGPGLVEALRRRGSRIPVVLMSSHYHGVDLPGVHFVAKPFALDHLVRTIVILMRQKH
jgi:DNA-binding response OmpR family regulator